MLECVQIFPTPAVRLLRSHYGWTDRFRLDHQASLIGLYRTEQLRHKSYGGGAQHQPYGFQLGEAENGETGDYDGESKRTGDRVLRERDRCCEEQSRASEKNPLNRISN